MKHSHHTSGFSLVEVMLALTIFAFLLAAVGAALQASLNSYTENDTAADLTQMARTVVDRMTKQARSAADVTSAPGVLTVFFDSAHLNGVTYAVNGNQLLYTTLTNGVSLTSCLLGAGDDVTVTGLTVLRREDATPRTLAVTVTLNLSYAGKPLSVTSSAVLRANLDW